MSQILTKNGPNARSNGSRLGGDARAVAKTRGWVYTQTMNGKIATVVAIGAIVAALLCGWAWLYFAVGGSLGGSAGMWMRAISSIVAGGAIAFLGVAMAQRIIEIKRGDDDDLGDY